MTESGRSSEIRKKVGIAAAIFPFVEGGFHLEQSLPFRIIVYCPFHEEDKVDLDVGRKYN